ncbi:MAG: urease accessory protein UreD [Microcoleaceae cyanobacterium]
MLQIQSLAPESSKVWRGQLELEFRAGPEKTQLVHPRTKAPLRVLRPHYPEDSGRCYTTIVHTAGGLVGGDQLEQTIRLQPKAQVLLTTAAASKVYLSIGPTARQSTHLSLGNHANLEWFPQETIVFNGANYHQSLQINLDPDATVLLWEITRFGRSARGERFLTGQWRSDLEVWQAGIPVWIDRQCLTGDAVALDSPHGLQGCPVVGTLAFVGRPATPTILDTLQRLAIETEIPTTQIGITENLNGFVCRYRGDSSQIARQYFIAVWQYLRHTWYGRMPSRPRVWL